MITNQTGVDCGLRSTIDVLAADPRVDLVALFGPEHGVRGAAQAGVPVGSTVDERTGVPAYSLYGEIYAPTRDMLTGLDALIFDIQDVGSRFATYLSTMVHGLRAASEADLPYVVLDRPNPITGTRVEGGLLDPAFESFVGVYPLPIRHGMTFGELARLIAAEEGWPEPVVVLLEGWRRNQWFDETGLPWVLPSPNLPTLESTALYPGTCLIEGTNLSEGRGITRPFEIIGAPWLDPFEFAAEMGRRAIPGALFRPTWFAPTFSKHQGVTCGGIQIHVTDRGRVHPVALGVQLLDVVRNLGPEEFAWRQGENGRYFADLLFGSDRPRQIMDAGGRPDDVMNGWEQQQREFEERRAPYLLYR